MGFFDKIKKIGIFNGFSELTEDFYEELEESLVMADLGAETTMEAVDELRERCKARGIKDTEGARQCMREILAEYLDLGGAYVDMSGKPAVILFIIFNLARKLKDDKLKKYITANKTRIIPPAKAANF